ncbi:Hypothetical predicted protein [Lecanosticta acicola]|uniref:NAD(P)-binding domain-containing protein n=1 Tax=Lecanosticta acicola TaxID=111012 RepID=A0AAI9E8L8_9PEZI|nr:Hypothetical predicted protein [Lecanosticta acicola]
MFSHGHSVFILGPGFIGLELIDRLLEQKYNVTTLVRRKEAAQDLEKRGVKTILGTLADSDIIADQSASHDIIFHTATADDLPSVEAVIRGIDQRANEGRQTIYIHTSGCSSLSDQSQGAYASNIIYTDKDPGPLDALSDDASHREIDLAIIRARQRLGSKAKTFLMLPPLIYGANKYGRLSIHIPTMARFALKHNYAGYVGGGEGRWTMIHVSDLSRGYMTMLQWLEQSPPEVALEHPYFFCENGEELSWKQLATFIGEDLHAAGRIAQPDPREIPKEQYHDLFGPYSMVVIGSNARNRGERLRELGWKPTHLSVRQSFHEEDLPVLLKEEGEFKGYAGVAASGSG